MADLDSILSGEGARASETPATVEKEVTTQETATTEQSGAETTGEQTGAENEGGNQKMVPHEALHAEKQKVKRYTEQVASFEKTLADREAAWERRFTQLLETVKPKPAEAEKPAPEIWDDADGFINQRLAPVQEAVQTQREQFSQIMAVEKHGVETVRAAMEAFKAQPETPARAAMFEAIKKSVHPYGALVEWHKREQERAEFADPAAYRDKLKAEILAELQAGNQPQGQGQQTQQPAVVMPTDLAGVRNVGTRSGPAYSGPASLNDIFDRSRKPKAA